MRKAIKIFGIVGLIICLVIMYTTDHGIRGIQKHDPDFRLLDMQFRYDTEVVDDTFEKIGDSGREAYQNFLLLDFVFILCFLFTMLTITNTVFPYSRIKTIFLWICVVRALFDILENSFLLIMLNSYPVFNDTPAAMCARITTLKFVVLYVWISGISVRVINTTFGSTQQHKS